MSSPQHSYGEHCTAVKRVEPNDAGGVPNTARGIDKMTFINCHEAERKKERNKGGFLRSRSTHKMGSTRYAFTVGP